MKNLTLKLILHFRFLKFFILGIILSFFVVTYTQAQVNLRIVINGGSSSTTCTDGFLGGAPEPMWGLNIASQGIMYYPRYGICFNNPVGSVPYNRTFNCSADYPSSLQLVLEAFEDDGTACVPVKSCLQTSTQTFSTPVPGSPQTYTMSVSGAFTSSATISFTIIATGGFIPFNTNTQLFVKKGSNGTGTSWTNAFGELSSAINALNKCQNTGITQIWVAAGTYKPDFWIDATTFQTTTVILPAGNTNRDKTFFLKSGIALYGGFAGTETLLSQRNFSNNQTILSGDIGTIGTNTDNVYHVVVSNNPTSATRLDGFIVQDGYADNVGSSLGITLAFGVSPGESGGGILTQGGGSNLTLTNCVVRNNNARYFGAGISNKNSSPIISNVIISNNVAVISGAMHNFESSPTISNTIIANNQTVSLGGFIANIAAIISNINNSSPIFNNMVIYGNSSVNVKIMTNYNNCNPILKNCIFWENICITPNVSMPNFFDVGGSTTASYSNITDGFAGTGNTNTDPLFVNPLDIDGDDNLFFTADDGFALRCSSPAINTGTNTGAPATDVLNLATIGTKDMGAYEFNDILGNAFLATTTQSNATLVRQCENNGWTYYSLSTEPNKWLIGINWEVDGTLSSLNNIAKNSAQVKITVDASNTSATNTPTQQGIWATKRYWNVSIGVNTLDEPVSVRYYYDMTEITAINTAASTFATTNGTSYIPAKFFKTVGTAFNPATQVTYDNINNGNTITLAPNTTPTGAHNGVDYVEFTNITSFSGGGAFTQAGVTPLPVELLNFEGKAQNNTNILTWTTTNEVNNKYFEIERSTNATEFTKIGVVDANTSNESIKSYTFSDVSFDKNTNYYRLKQVDSNNNTSFSKIISIKSSENTNITVNIFPNPSKNTFVIDVNGIVSDKYSVVVYDMQGKSVVNTKVSSNICVISLDNCVSGVYFVKISTTNSVIIKKIVKN